MRILVTLLVALLLSLSACSQPATAGGDAPVDATDVQFSADVQDDVADAPGAIPDAKDAAADAADVAVAVPDVIPDIADVVHDVADAISDVSDVVPDAPDIVLDAVDALVDALDVVPDAADLVSTDASADLTAADVPVLGTKAGCADGTREGYADLALFPTIAACGGAWDQPGIFNMAAKCNNQGGNDGLNAAGVGCTVTDLCAVGWHVCYGKDDVVFRNKDGCAGVMTGATPPVFFTTQMSSSGSFNCASGATATNDLFGCGNLGCDFTGNATCKALCSPLTLSSHDLCKGLRNDLSCGDWCNHLGKYPGAPNSWDCGTDGDKEALNVVKSHPEQQGGVLCCLD